MLDTEGWCLVVIVGSRNLRRSWRGWKRGVCCGWYSEEEVISPASLLFIVVE